MLRVRLLKMKSLIHYYHTSIHLILFWPLAFFALQAEELIELPEFSSISIVCCFENRKNGPFPFTVPRTCKSKCCSLHQKIHLKMFCNEEMYDVTLVETCNISTLHSAFMVFGHVLYPVFSLYLWQCLCLQIIYCMLIH